MLPLKDFVFVELNRGKLRLLTSDLKLSVSDVEAQVLNDSSISLVEGLASSLKYALKNTNIKASKAVFLLEEKDIYDRFFVVRNDSEDPLENLKAQACEFVGSSLDSLYHVFQKVSPFVYQFIGVPKEKIDTIEATCNKISLNLVAILPVSFVFAKYIGKYDPFFFVYKGEEESTLVASEYGGVYFSGTYSIAADVNRKITSLLTELSTFNRQKPITELLYMGDDVTVAESFVTKRIQLPFNVELKDYR